jgi:hypothetical protein
MEPMLEKKKRMSLVVTVVAFAGVVGGCGVETTPEAFTEGEGQAEAQEGESVAREASPLLVKSPTPFCLPGEVRKCTLGPPPVCRCEAATIDPVLAAW